MDTLKNITEQDITRDFENLKEVNINTISPLATVGNKVVNYCSFNARMHTKGKKCVSFVEFINNAEKYQTKPSYINFMTNNGNNKRTKINNQYAYFRLCYGSISIFKPIMAMMIYDRYKPTIVLDFTAGWGGRLVGAAALNVKKYIGVENNERLIEPYKKLSSFLSQHSITEIEMIFKNCLDVDYSKLNYDMVLTSPPYYNTEIYQNESPYATKNEWNTNFYVPIFEQTYKHLQKGGYYCLNIPIKIYENICVPLLGECIEAIPMPRVSRGKTDNYKEFIYVWRN